MKKEEKKELLCKLREISHLDRNQRFSEKVFRHLRPTNKSQEASVHYDNYLCSQIASPTAYQVLLSPMQSPSSAEGSINNNSITLQGIRQQSLKQRNFTQETGRQYYQQAQYLSFRNESMEGKVRFSKSKLNTGPSQANSTMANLSHNQDNRAKAKCPECAKKNILRDQTLERLTSEIKQLKMKLEDYQQRYNNLKKAIQPYKNNVSLMAVILQSIKEKGRSPDTEDCEEQVDFDLQTSTNELKQTTKVNLWLLKEGKQKDKHFNNQKYMLKCEIDSIAAQNSQLKKQIKERQQKMRFFEEQLLNVDSNHPLRQRLDMCAQELYMFKLKYQQKVKENSNLNVKIEEMKYKLNVLTSLIGCAIIFDVHEKEKDKKHLKEILNKIDKYEHITNHRMDNNVFQYLKILKSEQTDAAGPNKDRKSNKLRINRKESLLVRDETKDKETSNQLRRLYYPNYLVLLGEQSISARLQHIVIKPALFIKIRSILDSKYIDYRLFESSASKFSQFCNSHLRTYDIQSADKKPYYITRMMSENQIKEINLEFIRCLMDERIEDIPEVEIFRDMLLGKYEEDQIYFYLMCRHKFVEGSELQNFINSGDPSKLIKFDKAKRIVIKITQKFGRSIQNFICHHLNERRMVKSNRQFIRLYYLLKLLLQVYTKIRAKKLSQLKQLFEHVLETTKKDKINFMQFYQLLRKNFEFLTRTDICSMYQQTIAIFQSQNQLEGTNNVQFFQCFSAVTSTKIFLQEMMKFDVKLGNDCEEQEMIINYKIQSLKQSQIQQTKNQTKYHLSHSKKQTSSRASSQINGHEAKLTLKRNEPNKVSELWPDSVYVLGNERLTKQYFELCKSNPSKLRNKIDTLQFLLSISMGHLVKQDIHMNHKQDLMSIVNDAINNLVQFLNKLQNSKLQYENEINLASRKIGKFFKNKIYQFYHEMLEDINAIAEHPDKKGKNNKQNKLVRTIKMI